MKVMISFKKLKLLIIRILFLLHESTKKPEEMLCMCLSYVLTRLGGNSVFGNKKKMKDVCLCEITLVISLSFLLDTT